MQNIVVVGGGIAGMLSAYFLSLKTDKKVCLVEKSPKLGGLLKSFDYGKYGHFDYGAHNILKSGIEELDRAIIGLLQRDEWTTTSAINGQKRALTGVYFKDRLQAYSPFVDLREMEDIDELKIDFLNHFEESKSIDNSSAYTYAKSIFGSKITDRYIEPIFHSLYGVSSKKMDYMAMYLTPLTRVGLFNQKIMDDLLCASNLSKHLAYPDQMVLSPQYFGTKETYYPKNYGIYRVIDKLEEKLREQGVEILLSSTVERINYTQNHIESIVINGETAESIDHLFYSAGLNSLHKLLGVQQDEVKSFDRAPKTVITNLLIDKELKLDDLCYLYNYDDKYQTFRIDNYIKYCENAKREEGYPVSVEMLLADESLSKERISENVVKELRALKVLDEGSNINFIETEILEYGFPLLTVNNINVLDKIREEIEGLGLENLKTIGVLSNKDLFFESDIKKDLYLKIMEIVG